MRVGSRRLSQRIPFQCRASSKGSFQTTIHTQAQGKTFPHQSVPEEDEPIVQIETIESREANSDCEYESDWENYDIDTSPSRFAEDDDFQITAAADDDKETDHSNDDCMWTSFHCTDFLVDHVFVGPCSMHSIGGNGLTKTRTKAVSLRSFLAKVLGQESTTDQETFGSVNCTSLSLPNYFKTKEHKKSKYYKAAVVRVLRRIQDKSKSPNQRSVQAEFPDSVIRKLERLAVLRKRRDLAPHTVKLNRGNRSLPSKKALELFCQHNRTRSMIDPHSIPIEEESAVNDLAAIKDVKELADDNREEPILIDASQSHLLTPHSSPESVESESSRHSGSCQNSGCPNRASTKETVVENETATDECLVIANENIMEEELVQPSNQSHSTATKRSGFLATAFGKIDVPAICKEFMFRISGKQSSWGSHIFSHVFIPCGSTQFFGQSEETVDTQA